MAAAAGIGTLQAARERERYAIGVDTNQNDLEPGFVVASDIKDVGKAIQEVYKSIVDGAYKPGAVLQYGLASGGVDLVTDAQVKVLPEAIMAKVAELRQQIIDGTLKIQIYDGSESGSSPCSGANKGEGQPPLALGPLAPDLSLRCAASSKSIRPPSWRWTM